MKVLKRYDIKIKQIYAITTYNGRNMVKATELLGLQLEDEILLEEDIDVPHFDENNLNQILGNPINNANETIFSISSIKCMTHTLQLAVNDVIKTSFTKKIIEKAQDVVVKLRTQTLIALLKAKGLKKPVKNIVTRWNSTYKYVLFNIYFLY